MGFERGISLGWVRVSANELQRFCLDTLVACKVRNDVASHVALGLVQASLRGVDSHGVRLLPHYLRAVKGGRLNPNPTYRFERTALATGLLDGDHTFGHAAGMEAAKKAVDLAIEAGAGHVVVCNSSHFGAAAYFALKIAGHDMIGLSFTSTDALIQSYGGTRPFLGNNPLCIAAPCEEEEPFCLDMATSVVTFNKVRQWCEEGVEAPPGVGADRDGTETTDPNQIMSLLPIGGYKGYGLSMAIEILCGLLSGMAYGPHIPKMFEAPMDQKRLLGHFVTAIRIDCFQDIGRFKSRLSTMMRELRSEPRLDPDIPIQVPGDPEKRVAEQRLREGIPLTPAEVEALNQVARECRVPWVRCGKSLAI